MTPLRFSVLKQMARSPKHAQYAMLHEPPDTPAMRLGRLTHALTLGTPIGPVWEGTRRGKAWDAFEAEHAGEDIVTGAEVAIAGEMSAAVMANPEAYALVGPDHLDRAFERTIYFKYAGRECRATPDVFDPKDLTELKSTFDASPLHFPFHALRMGYHAQTAWQKDAMIADGLKPPETINIVAVESRPPYAVAVFIVTPRAEDLGRRLYRSWIEQLLVCEASNDWPGYGPGILDVPDDEFAPAGLSEEDLSGFTNEQGELALSGLAAPFPPGIMPSRLSKDDAARLKAQRDAAIGRQEVAK